MQRNLIGYAAFEKLKEKNLPATQFELIEAEDLLSRVLETGLTFHSFNENHVIYETEDGTFVRANYKHKADSIILESIEEIVIDEASEANARKDVIREMIAAVLEDNKAKANTLLDEVMKRVRDGLKRESAAERNSKVNEAAYSRRKPRRGNKAGVGVSVRHGAADPGRSRRAKEGHRKNPRAAFTAWKTRKRRDPGGDRTKRDRKLYGGYRRSAAAAIGRKHKKHMTEWLQTAQNVFGYVDFMENGRVINEAAVQTNNKGDITAVQIPTSQSRNEGKILAFHLKTLKTDLKVLREAAKRLPSDRNFVEKVAELKRHNNLADNDSLEECLGEIVSKYPSVLYLTQTELSEVLSTALSNSGVSNYDDKQCDFMAEGILRVAHGAYNDRVTRIHNLSGNPVKKAEDPYVEFQSVVEKFYPSLDESIEMEMKVFEDLYAATLEVRRAALEAEDDELREDAEELAGNLQSVLEGESVPSLELAQVVAGWLENLVETNLDSSDWEVTKIPHLTVTGDHPDMAKKARHPYTPANDFSGDWGSELPQLDADGKGYKTFGNKAKNTSYTGLVDGGKSAFSNMYPDVQNPYVPKSIIPTMKGEPGVDKNWESGLAQWQDTNTWGTGLNNPYVPKSLKPHVNNDNRVDDRENNSTDMESGVKGSMSPEVGLNGKRIDGR